MQNQQEIEELEQYGRRLCLRFEGIPTEKNKTSDKVLKKIMGIFKESGVEIPDKVTQSAFTCSKLTIESLEQSVKYVQS